MSSGPVPTLLASAVIRPLAFEDLDTVLDIERQSYSHPWSETVFRDCFRSNYRLWALAQDDAVIGYAIVAYQVDEAHLLNLCVAPFCRQQGAARYLLQQVLASSREDGMRQVLLEVRESNEPARHLYRRQGFSTIGRRPDYYPDTGGREAAEIMSLALSA